VWWIALFVFLLLIMAGFVVLIQFLRSRGKRPKRTRGR
jgi:heme/copper-type cytochrome/quinol oxidase subunit 2